jgi:hypothetical protein
VFRVRGASRVALLAKLAKKSLDEEEDPPHEKS